MKVKREYVIIACVIVALGLYIGLRSGDRTHYELPEVPEVAADDLTKIVITRGDTALTVERMDDRWLIRPYDYRADGGTVDRMLEAMSSIRIEALVSESKVYSRYGLEPENAIEVEAWAGDRRVRELLIGKNARNTRHTFVRVPGDDRVYQAKGAMRSTFDTSIDPLRDKAIKTLDREAIERVEMAGKANLTLMRVPVGGGTDTAAVAPVTPPEYAWRSLDGREADETAVGRLLGAIAGLRADGFVYGDDAAGSGEPIGTLTAAAGERRVTLTVYPKREDGKHVVVASSATHPFLVSEWRAKQLLPEADTLLPEE